MCSSSVPGRSACSPAPPRSGSGRASFVVDPNERRLGLARRFGLEDAWTPGELARRAEALRADVLIDCSGSLAALNPALAAVRPAGTVVVVGMAQELVALGLEHLQRRELTVVGSFRYAGCFPDAIELAASGQIPLEAIITSRFPLRRPRSRSPPRGATPGSSSHWSCSADQSRLPRPYINLKMRTSAFEVPALYGNM